VDKAITIYHSVPSLFRVVASSGMRFPNLRLIRLEGDRASTHDIDDFRAQLRQVQHGFYLTGGTALSRGYYQHRYSEDLDLFLNDSPDFEISRDRCISGIREAATARGWQLEISLREERFGRAFLHGPIPLKLEFINDVPFRVGLPWDHPILGPLDTKENILANKISALLDRQEPKDLADLFWLCCRDRLDLLAAIEQAGGKAAGVFPPAVARALSEGSRFGLPKVAWSEAPSAAEFRSGLESLIRRIIE
jgi:hypothetical protein